MVSAGAWGPGGSHNEEDTMRHKHDWQAPYSVVGGIRENPGCWSIPGANNLRYDEVCSGCGAWRTTYSYGGGTRRERKIVYLNELDADRQARVRAWLAGQSED
jgi:hypothetical protein